MDKPASSYRPGRAAWMSLLLMFFTHALSMVDRQVLAILVPRIRADLGVGDAEMGLLYGTVFALFYAVFSLPLGRLADGWNRSRLLGISVLLWSGMTALAGFASHFGTLLVSRLGVGVGEASVQPASMSLLSDHFPRRLRATVTGVVAAGIALGLGAALWIGGATADWWDARYAAGGAPLGLRGWQAAFLVAALPGLVLTPFLLAMRDPPRGLADGIPQPHDPHPFRAAGQVLYSILPVTNWLGFLRARASGKVWLGNLLALALIALAVWALTGWTEGLRSGAKSAPMRIGGMTISGSLLQWLVLGAGCYVIVNWLQGLFLRDRPAFHVIAGTPSVGLLMTIGALQNIINYGVMAWTPSFIMQRFQLTAAEVGLTYGVMIAVIGIIGPLVAGPLSDWLGNRLKGGKMIVTLLAVGLSPLLAWAAFNAQSMTSFYLRFSLFSFVLTMWMPPVYAGMLDMVLPRMRGATMSLYLLISTMTGLGIGPYLIGLLSDLNGGDMKKAILSVFWVAPLQVLVTLLLIRRMPRDEATLIERARAAGEPI